MPNFKSISFNMAVLQGGGQSLPSPCVCYPKDPMRNRVNKSVAMATTLITVHCKLKVRKFHQPTANRFSTARKNF